MITLNIFLVFFASKKSENFYNKLPCKTELTLLRPVLNVVMSFIFWHIAYIIYFMLSTSHSISNVNSNFMNHVCTASLHCFTGLSTYF